jgi:hypothetical protein
MGNEIENRYQNVIDAYFNPANEYSDRSDEVSQFIYELYEETGDKSVIPPKAPYYINDSGNKINLSSKQVADYQKIAGQKASDYIAELLETPAFNNSDTEEKVNVIKDIYSYSSAIAKEEVAGVEIKDKTKAKLKMYEDNGLDPIFVYLADVMAEEYSEKHTAEDGVTKSDYKKAVRQSDFEKDIQDLLIALKDASGKKNEDNLVKSAFDRFN